MIAFVAGAITILLGLAGMGYGAGFLGGTIRLVIAALDLFVGDRLLPGQRTEGFSGALIAAFAIGASHWLRSML